MLRALILASSLAALLMSSAFAQSNSDGWVDLKDFSTESTSQTSSNRPDDDWIDLENYEGVPSPEWQSIESINLDSDTFITPQSQASVDEAAWLDIDDEITAAASDMVLPTGRISAGDMIDISVANADSLTGAYRISALGTLVLPLIGSVDVAGLSAEEIKERLEQLYGSDYLVNPDITVTARETVIGQVALDGLINRKGSVSLTSVESLASVISKRGGVSGARKGLDAIILRKIGNGIRARRVPLDSISLSDLPGPTLLPGDRVSILKREKLPEMKDDSGQYPLLDKVLSGGSLRTF